MYSKNLKKEDWLLLSPKIQQLLIEGKSMPEIAKELNLPYERLVYNYKPIKKNFKYFDTVNKEVKVEAVNAASFTFNKEYTIESLTEEDLKAHRNYELKHKAYYEQRNS